jgi:catechol 2,3-dioxygenase-like lactoylglutathione lyase family enzyme
MNSRIFYPFVIVPFMFALMVVCMSGKSSSQEPQDSPASGADVAKGLDVLRSDEGTWDADVSLWLRPGSEPIKSRAVVTARMAVGGMYLEQRFEGTFGPEMANKAWSTLSYTNFNATTGMYETVRMASSESPMIVVRGKATSHDEKGVSMELTGEYMLNGSEATERDVIRHEGPDKIVIESWMSFAGSVEYKGAEFVLTRTKAAANSENSEATEKPRLRLGNFSVSLAVKDLAASRAFYEKLGFKVFAGNPKNYLIMQNETSTIGLFQGMFDKNILTYNPGWDRSAATLPDFDDVREIQRALKDQGLVLTTEADETTTGPASVTLLDPDGNLILIDQHVPSPQK